MLSRMRALRQTDGWIFTAMLVSALLSLTASLVLSIDAVKLAADPGTALSCNINQVISCGKVGTTWQANLLGFPNAFLGLIAEPVVITIAVASLGKVKFPRWFMFSAQIVYLIGVLFAYWLFVQAYFVIGALCPWCLLVTLSTTSVFTSLTHVNVRDENLFLPPRASKVAQTIVENDLDLLMAGIIILTITAMIVVKYVPMM